MMSELEQKYPYFIKMICEYWGKAEDLTDWNLISARLIGAFQVSDDLEIAEELRILINLVFAKN